MADPTPSEDELIRSARSYLTRVGGEPPPRDLEERVARFVFSRRRRFSLAALLGGGAVMVAATAAAVVALAFHQPPVAGIPAGTPTHSQLVTPSTPTPTLTPAAAATPTPTARPTPAPPTTHLSLSGALNGDLRAVHTVCGQHQIIHNILPGGGGTFDASYIYATGTMPDGHSILIQVNDPAGPDAWDGGYVMVMETLSGVAPTNPYSSPLPRVYSSWLEGRSPAGISQFNLNHGATLHSLVPPWQIGSTVVPSASVLVSGVIVCP